MISTGAALSRTPCASFGGAMCGTFGAMCRNVGAKNRTVGAKRRTVGAKRRAVSAKRRTAGRIAQWVESPLDIAALMHYCPQITWVQSKSGSHFEFSLFQAMAKLVLLKSVDQTQ